MVVIDEKFKVFSIWRNSGRSMCNFFIPYYNIRKRIRNRDVLNFKELLDKISMDLFIGTWSQCVGGKALFCEFSELKTTVVQLKSLMISGNKFRLIFSL